MKYADEKVQLKALRKTLLCGLDVSVNGTVHMLLCGVGFFYFCLFIDNSFFLLHKMCFYIGNIYLNVGT